MALCSVIVFDCIRVLRMWIQLTVVLAWRSRALYFQCCLHSLLGPVIVAAPAFAICSPMVSYWDPSRLFWFQDFFKAIIEVLTAILSIKSNASNVNRGVFCLYRLCFQ